MYVVETKKGALIYESLEEAQKICDAILAKGESASIHPWDIEYAVEYCGTMAKKKYPTFEEELKAWEECPYFY